MGTCQELGNQPERLGLDVLDHDGVHELPPAVVRAEPAAHVPGGRPTHAGAPTAAGRAASGGGGG